MRYERQRGINVASCVCMRIQCLTYPHSTKPSEAKLVGWWAASTAKKSAESNGGNTVRSEHIPNPILISLTRDIMGHVQDYFKKQIQKSRNPEDVYI